MDIDSLQIKINASATAANSEIDRLITKIQSLSSALSGFDRSKVDGINSFTNAMSRLGKVNVGTISANLPVLSQALSNMMGSMNALPTVNSNITAFVNAIGRLSGKNITQAAVQLPKLTTALHKMITEINKMPSVNNNIVQFINNLTRLNSTSNNTSNNTRTLSYSLSSLRSAFSRTGSSLTSLAAAFGKFYASYFLIIRGIKKLWEAIKGTADYMEAYNFFAVAEKKIASKWDENFKDIGEENAETYVNAYKETLEKTFSKLSGLTTTGDQIVTTDAKNLGLNLTEITQYASAIASITDAMGMVGDASTMVSNDFVRLAGDISSLFNLDYSEASSKLQSGLIGQSRALYSFGIDITQATLAQYAFNLGIEKSVSEMTQGEKAQLRYIAIMDQSRVSWGDLANTINSPANMLRMFTNTLKECGTVLGQLFIPILQKVLPVLTAIAMAFKRLMVDIASFFGISIDLSDAAMGYADISDVVEETTDGIEGATEAAKEFKNQLMGFDEINKLNDNSDSSSGASGMSDTLNLLSEMQKYSDEYNKKWNEAFEKMKNSASEMSDTIYNKIKNVIKTLWDLRGAIAALVAVFGTLSIVGKIFSGFLGLLGVVEPLATLFPSLGPAIEGMATAFLGALGPILMIVAAIVAVITVITLLYVNCEDFRNFMNEIFVAVADVFATAFDRIRDKIQEVADKFDGFGERISVLVDVLKIAIEIIITLLEGSLGTTISTLVFVVCTAIDAIVTVIQFVLTVIEDIIETIINVFVGFYEFFAGIFTGDIDRAIKGVLTIFASLLRGITKIFGDIIKAIKDTVTSLGKNMFNWGKDIISNFINGIKAMMGGVGDAVSSIADKISSFLHHSTPDEGPLKDDDIWMEDMMKNFANGITKNKNLVLRSAESLAEGLNYAINPTMTVGANSAAGSFTESMEETTNSNQIIKVYVGDKELTNFVVKGINDMTMQNGVTPLMI